MVLPFSCWLTSDVLENRPLNGCSSSSSMSCQIRTQWHKQPKKCKHSLKTYFQWYQDWYRWQRMCTTFQYKYMACSPSSSPWTSSTDKIDTALKLLSIQAPTPDTVWYTSCTQHKRTHNYYNKTHTHNTTILRLCGICPGKPGWAGTRRNIHPLLSS